MKMKLWFAYKLLIGNWKRAIFPLLGVTGGVIALIMSLSLGAGGEKIISNDLSAMSDNRIMVGGANMDMRDMQIIEGYPMVQYAVFPEARIETGGNIFRGYSPKALAVLGLNQLNDREVILDKNQFPESKKGDKIRVSINNREYEFIIRDIYEEKNPFELMKQGDRIIISQSYYQRLFERYTYKQLIVAFDKNEDVEEYIPYILKKFNQDRGGFERVTLLETPEVYKRIVKIQKLVKNVLGLLSVISLCIGGFGIMNLVASGVRARIGHIGIMRAIGTPKKDVVSIFLIEGIIISIIGSIIGIILGSIISIILGKLIAIKPEFNIFQIVCAMGSSVILGVVMGIYPAAKIGKIDIIQALREN